jgi:opacity protein-like surface antigen
VQIEDASAQAKHDTSMREVRKWRPVLGFSYGQTKISSLGKPVYIPISNASTDEFYNYAPNAPTAKSISYTLFFGFEHAIFSNWRIQTGLAYYKTSQFATSGILTQGADTASQDTYGYHYNVSPQSLLLEAKLLYSIRERYHPYVLFGLGPAFNKAHDFGTTVPYNLAFTRAYADHVAASLSYTFGMGVDVNVTSKIRLGLGYRMMDLGTAQFGQSSIDGTAVSKTLSQTHIRASEIMLQLTGIFLN